MTHVIMLSSEMDECWKITDRFPYLENVTILNDFSTEFRGGLKRLKGIKKLRINSDGFTIDYVTSDKLNEVEVIAPNRREDISILDYLIHILKINRGINRLIYTRGFLSNESIYYMTRNRIKALKLADVQTDHLTTLSEYLGQNTLIEHLSIMGLQSEYIQNIIFTEQVTNMNHIYKLTIHILDTQTIHYTSIRNFRGLRSISLYFSYCPNSESNVLTVLDVMKNAKFLQHIRIYRIRNDN